MLRTFPGVCEANVGMMYHVGADLGFFLQSSDVSTFTFFLMFLSAINGKDAVPGCYLPLLGYSTCLHSAAGHLIEWSRSLLTLLLWCRLFLSSHLHHD